MVFLKLRGALNIIVDGLLWDEVYRNQTHSICQNSPRVLDIQTDKIFIRILNESCLHIPVCQRAELGQSSNSLWIYWWYSFSKCNWNAALRDDYANYASDVAISTVITPVHRTETVELQDYYHSCNQTLLNINIITFLWIIFLNYYVHAHCLLAVC